MADVNELIYRIRMNIDMAEMYGSAYFNQARRLLMNDLPEAIEEAKNKQDLKPNKLQITVIEHEPAKQIVEN